MPKYRRRRPALEKDQPLFPRERRILGEVVRNERLIWDKFSRMCVYVLLALLLIAFSRDHKPRTAFYVSSSVTNVFVNSTYTNGQKLLKVCWFLAVLPNTAKYSPIDCRNHIHERCVIRSDFLSILITLFMYFTWHVA